MKQIWKKYYREIRLTANAKWYLDNIQPLSISMNQAYARHKQNTIELSKNFGRPEPIRVKCTTK